MGKWCLYSGKQLISYFKLANIIFNSCTQRPTLTAHERIHFMNNRQYKRNNRIGIFFKVFSNGACDSCLVCNERG